MFLSMQACRRVSGFVTPVVSASSVVMVSSGGLLLGLSQHRIGDPEGIEGILANVWRFFPLTFAVTGIGRLDNCWKRLSRIPFTHCHAVLSINRAVPVRLISVFAI